MSLRIIKTGVLDTVQDCGRFGHQHLGMNPTGAMDRFSARLSNALIGKDLDAPVLELHFPAAQILFEKEAVICLCGADFSPVLDDRSIPLDHPVAVKKNSVLKFTRLQTGARCYLSLLQGFAIDKWLNSYSTHLKAGAGGYKGRALQKDDIVSFREKWDLSSVLQDPAFHVLPWKALDTVDTRNEIEFLIGSEWPWLSGDAQELFQTSWFQITNEADRVGYRLAGSKLDLVEKEQLVSSAVGYGTVQLLPTGQLIILMADHQTTGGYPRIAHVVSAHLPILAQKKPNDVVRFRMTNLAAAEEKIVKQQKYLQQLQIACKFRIENLLGKGAPA
jgi:antagonist of KipI